MTARRGDKFKLSWIEGTCVITCVRKGIVYFMSPHDSWQMPLETFMAKVQQQRECPTCKGSGKVHCGHTIYLNECPPSCPGHKPCEVCKGTGRVTR